jgi:hypothetical protein
MTSEKMLWLTSTLKEFFIVSNCLEAKLAGLGYEF